MAVYNDEVVLNFKMNGQVQYANTLKDINNVMNVAAKEYKNHIAAMGKDASATSKLRAEKQKLEIQMQAAEKRTSLLRAEYEKMANESNATSDQLTKMYGRLLDSERAQASLNNAMQRVNEGLSQQAQETREAESTLSGLKDEAKLLEAEQKRLTSSFALQSAELGENATESEKTALAQKQLSSQMDLARRSINNLEGQLDASKRAYGENSTEVIQLETKLNEARTSMTRFERSLKDVQTASDKTERSMDGLKTGLAGLVGAGSIGAMGGFVSSMQETNQQLAMMETQVQNTGVAIEDIEGARNSFAAVGQDVTQATESMGNLTQAGFKTKDELEDIAEGISGAIVKYGNTFSSEGLAESINSTAQLGEATGQLTDLLEKEGINVEKFNEKLSGIADETDRANFISQTFADQGLNSMYEQYTKANPEIVKQAESQREMEQALSELSVILTPLVTQVSDFVTRIIEWANENPKLVEGIGIAVGVIGGLGIALGVVAPILATLTGLATALGVGLLPLIGIIAGVAAAITGIILVIRNWSTITEFISEKWSQFISWITEVVSKLASDFSKWFTDMKNSAVDKFNELKNGATDKFNELQSKVVGVITKFKNNIVNRATEIKNGFVNRATELKNSVIDSYNGLKSKAESIVNNLKNGVVNKFNELKNNASEIMQNAKDLITDPIDTAKDTISDIIDEIKGFFSGLKLKLPKIELPKMPKFEISGGFSLKPLKVPKISVKWNADGGIFTTPTIFGMNNGVLQGAGEAGPEAALPLNEQTLGAIGRGIASTMQNNSNRPIILQIDGKQFAQVIGDYTDHEGGVRIRRMERGLA